MSKFIQVGLTAMRDPATGEMLESVPLYVENSADIAGKLPREDFSALRPEMIERLREAIRTAKQRTRKGGKA